MQLDLKSTSPLLLDIFKRTASILAFSKGLFSIFNLTPNDDLMLAVLPKLTPAFAAGLERSGKPVRQHALVSCSIGQTFS